MDKKAMLSRVRFTLAAEEKAVRALTKALDSSFVEAVELLTSRRGKIIITGVGKSGFVGMKMAASFTSLGHPAFFLNPLDALHGDAGMVSSGDVVISISFSGESIEAVKLIAHLRKTSKIAHITITGRSISRLASLSDVALLTYITEEGSPLGLAPMASTTAALVMGDLLASALTSPESFKKGQFAKFHPGGTLGLSLRAVKEVMTSGEQLPSVREGVSFGQALEEITNKKLGIVGVVNQRSILVGTVTDGDIRRILLKYDEPKSLSARSVMTKNPKFVYAEATLKEALAVMEEFRVTSLFVVDSKKKLLGVVHIHDIVENSLGL